MLDVTIKRHRRTDVTGGDDDFIGPVRSDDVIRTRTEVGKLGGGHTRATICRR